MFGQKRHGPIRFCDVQDLLRERVPKQLASYHLTFKKHFHGSLVHCFRCIGLEDKRQITGLLNVTISGDILPPRLLYTGKTDQCHPRYDFPSDQDIFHSDNHWSNEDTIFKHLLHLSFYIYIHVLNLSDCVKLVFTSFMYKYVNKYQLSPIRSSWNCIFRYQCM